MTNSVLGRAIKLSVMSTLLFSSLSYGALINRGDGLIYDDVLDVTWMQNANYIQSSGFDTDGLVDHSVATSWVDGLSFAEFDDWRMPTLGPLNGQPFDISFSFDGTSDRGFDQSGTSSELVYMFLENLNNTSFFSTSGIGSQPGSESFNRSFLDGETGELLSF